MKKIRIILASAFIAGITLMLLGKASDWFGWMAEIQFMPSVMRVIADATILNVAIVAALFLVTVLFGRIYCSVICPLGVLQDIVIRLRRRFLPSSRFSFKPERKIVRYGILALTVVSLIAGLQVLVGLIAPYSAYGRIVRGVVGIGNGASWVAVTAGVSMLLIIVACAVFQGRFWCNTICPVGTVLGLVGRFAIFRPRIDHSKCVACGRCGRDCRSSCIDTKTRTIDTSRCVSCFDCVSSCHSGAISFSPFSGKSGKGLGKPNETSGSRRAFLATGAFLAGAAVAKAQNQGGLAELVEKKTPSRTRRIVPPGAVGEKHFYDSCTACQLCVAACPNSVLRPSTDLAHLLQPEAGYDKGWCRPECTSCSEVCPTDAILPLTKEEKTAVHIGLAVVNPDLCITGTDNVACGNCARHCPTGAIRMVKTEGRKRPIPVVNESVCIGCGACEFLCPARPVSAITVNGLETHIID